MRGIKKIARALTPFVFWTVLASPIPKPINIWENADSVEHLPEVRNSFLFLYSRIDRELHLCQYGLELKGKIIVYDVNFPVIINSTKGGTNYVLGSCNSRDYIGMTHNHPNDCYTSDVDNDRFNKDKEAKIETIVCFADIESDSLVIKTYQKDHIQNP